MKFLHTRVYVALVAEGYHTDVVLEVNKHHEGALVVDEHASPERPVVVKTGAVVARATFELYATSSKPGALLLRELAKLGVLERAEHFNGLALDLEFHFLVHKRCEWKLAEVARRAQLDVLDVRCYLLEARERCE